VSRGDRGFTVVELLVAMTVLGLMMVLVMQGLRFAAGTRERLLGRSDAVQTVVLARGLLQRQVERAQLVVWGQGEQRRLGFSGTAERLRLAVVAPPYHAGAAWQLWEFALERIGDDRRRLLVRRMPLSYRAPGFEPLDDAPWRELMTIAAPVEFQFFGRPRDDTPAAWFGRWEGQQRLPQVIRLVDPTDRGAWPELVAAPRSELPAHCASGASEEDTGCPS
jgi:general secretion pathway protein J